MTARPRLIERLRWRFSQAPWAALAEIAARTGYVARGSVYISIGVVAVLAAAGLTPKAQGALGALAAWGAWPPAVALIWLIGLGLYGFAGWRALQALLDADTLGRTPKALAARAGQAVSGLVYGALAVSVFGFLDAIEDLHEADDQAKTAAFIAQLLALPAGEWLVMAAGAFILAAGIGNAIRALFGHFVRKRPIVTLPLRQGFLRHGKHIGSIRFEVKADVPRRQTFDRVSNCTFRLSRMKLHAPVSHLGLRVSVVATR